MTTTPPLSPDSFPFVRMRRHCCGVNIPSNRNHEPNTWFSLRLLLTQRCSFLKWSDYFPPCTNDRVSLLFVMISFGGQRELSEKIYIRESLTFSRYLYILYIIHPFLVFVFWRSGLVWSCTLHGSTRLCSGARACWKGVVWATEKLRESDLPSQATTTLVTCLDGKGDTKTVVRLPLVRSRRRATTVLSQIRCAWTGRATATRSSRRRRTNRRKGCSWGCRRIRWSAGRTPGSRSERRNTYGPDGPSSACSSPRRCCSCNRTPWSGDGSTVSVFLTCWTTPTWTKITHKTFFCFQFNNVAMVRNGKTTAQSGDCYSVVIRVGRIRQPSPWTTTRDDGENVSKSQCQTTI